MPVARVEARRRGRPRSAEADEAILAAAFAVFAECGFDGMTVEGVAARAGVGKGTIYRRYPNKLDLVIAASQYFAQERESAIDTGTIEGDLRAMVDRLIGVFTNTPVGTALPMLLAERRRIPELAAAHDEITARKRERNRAVIRRAIDRGELCADANPELVIDAVVSPVMYRFLVTDLALDARFANNVVQTVIRAFGAHADAATSKQ
jgi:AcrR family transcriptional regulator